MSFLRTSIIGLTVSNLTFASAAEASHGGGPFAWLMDPTTNVAFAAMVVFLAIAWRMGGLKAITGGLDTRAETIAMQLEEAKALREAAAKALAEAERRQRQADEDAASIVAQAKADSEAMMAEARASLAQRVQRREALAEERIQRAERQAASEIRQIAADTATEAARALLSKDTSVDQFEKAASEVEKALVN